VWGILLLLGVASALTVDEFALWVTPSWRTCSGSGATCL